MSGLYKVSLTVNGQAYEREVALFRQWLGEQKAAHWSEFAAAWE